MTKLLTTVFAAFLLSNVAMAQPYPQLTETNSLSRGALEIMAMNYNKPQTDIQAATPYTHESEKNNSLARAALAQQGTEVSLRFNSDSVITYSRDSTASERNNSFFRGVLAR